MPPRRTTSTWEVELTVSEFQRVLDRDEAGISKRLIIAGSVLMSEDLGLILSALGAYNVEYNGHYGPHIFYTLPVGKRHLKLTRAIAAYVKGEEIT